jgi:hypothetical protein
METGMVIVTTPLSAQKTLGFGCWLLLVQHLPGIRKMS